MKLPISKVSALALSLAASSIVLTGCLGGGGGDSSSPTAATGGSASGVAGSGLIKKARVRAFCGNNETTAMATGITGDGTTGDGSAVSKGAYSLSWTQSCASPVKIVVDKHPDTTKYVTAIEEEAFAADVTPDSNFKVSALIADPSKTKTQHITPFTHLVTQLVASDANATAIDNAKTAVAAVVLGGAVNVGLLDEKPIAPADVASTTTTTDQKQLLAALTTFSKLAAAETGDDSAKVAKAMDKLVTNVKADLGITATSLVTDAKIPTPVSATAGIALNAVKDNALPPTAPASGVTLPAVTVTTTAPTAIALPDSSVTGARKMFVALRDNVAVVASDVKTNQSEMSNLAKKAGLILDQTADARNLVDLYNNGSGPSTNPSLWGNLKTETATVVDPAVSGGTKEVTREYYAPQRWVRYTSIDGVWGTFACKVFKSGIGNNGTTDLAGTVACAVYTSAATAPAQGATTYQSEEKGLVTWVSKADTTGKHSYSNFRYTKTCDNPMTAGGTATCTSDNYKATTYTGKFAVVGNDGTGSTQTASLVYDADSKWVPLVTGAATGTDVALSVAGTRTGTDATGTGKMTMTGTIKNGDLSMALTSGSEINRSWSDTAGSQNGKLIGQFKTKGYTYDGTLEAKQTEKNPNSSSGQVVTDTASFTGTVSTAAGIQVAKLVANSDATDATSEKADVTFNFGDYFVKVAVSKLKASPFTETVTITSSDAVKLVRNTDGTIEVQDSKGTKIGVVKGATVNFSDGTYVLLGGTTVNLVTVPSASSASGSTTSTGTCTSGGGTQNLIFAASTNNSSTYKSGDTFCFTATTTSLSFNGTTLTSPTRVGTYEIYRFSTSAAIYEVAFVAGALHEINVMNPATDFNNLKAADNYGQFNFTGK